MYMDSSTYGVPVDSPEGYRTYVEYATRMSNSGIFLHAAPWSVGAQGNTNVSHGCLNVSTEDGKWFYENAKKGDPVIVQNTAVEPSTAGRSRRLESLTPTHISDAPCFRFVTFVRNSRGVALS